MSAPNAVVVIDYQNIHLTGHQWFCPPGQAAHLCLIHPLLFANAVLRKRNLLKGLIAQRDGISGFQPAVLQRVIAFRGQPSNKHEPKNYARTSAQKSEWTRDPRSEVVYRTLRYDAKTGDAQEKGIDVLVALELVTEAASAPEKNKVVILAAHDTDQEPALDLAVRLAGNRIETAGWEGRRVLRAKGTTLWHTKLDSSEFALTHDPKTYA